MKQIPNRDVRGKRPSRPRFGVRKPAPDFRERIIKADDALKEMVVNGVQIDTDQAAIPYL